MNLLGTAIFNNGNFASRFSLRQFFYFNERKSIRMWILYGEKMRARGKSHICFFMHCVITMQCSRVIPPPRPASLQDLGCLATKILGFWWNWFIVKNVFKLAWRGERTCYITECVSSFWLFSCFFESCWSFRNW